VIGMTRITQAFVHRVEIVNDQQVVASHARCWARECDILDPRHYLPLLARRPRAFAQSKAIRQWQKQWPAAFERYWQVLQQKLPETESTRVFVQILKLTGHYAEAEVAQALELALQHQCYSYDGVRELLRRLTETAPPPRLELAERPDLADIQVQPADLAQFNRLLPVGGPPAQFEFRGDPGGGR
jgi:hypothetical protein